MNDAASVAAWLPAWIARQIEVGVAPRAQVPASTSDAMYLYASMGVETALTSTGAVYVREYDIEASGGAPSSIRWRPAQGLERLGFIVLGARRFAELRALLPVPTADATPCPACRATGDWHVFSADRKESLRIRPLICKGCGGLGWQARPDA
jgi:hypothetical protein